MLLKDIMTPQVEAISQDALISEAARKMAANDVGFLPVIDATRAVGVVTDRDIVIRAVAEGLDANKTPVRDIMTADIAMLSEEEDVEEAARLMEEKQIRRILITGENGRYVGVVSLGDFAVETGNRELAAATLESVSAMD